MTSTETPIQKKGSITDWFIRLVKGIIIGVGFITPGLSGGVLAVVFGVYEPLMRFLANLKHKFVKNVSFFLPIGVGGVLGIIAFSAVVDYAFSHFAAQFIWLFIGFIAGTFPSLFKTAGKEGRKTWHWALLGGMAVLTLLFMRWMESFNNVTLPQTFLNWLLSGALIGLGVVVPGMSPSNFLIYLGLYQPMASGIRHLDLGVIIPLVLGLLVCVFGFARLVSWLFKKAYPVMFHLILGIVVGSTLAIIPGGVKDWTIAVCVVLFFAGGAISYLLSKLDEKHPHESMF
ncbi:MAG TPA: DUF368 domain-containing protein [Anaerolineaceae bacterium]|nr:DUF368 domain-containing protein [Anaerolineaceae bacterium]